MKCILHLTTSIPRKADICFIGDRLIGLIGRCEAPARNEREKVSTLEWDAKSDSSNKNKKKKNGNISKRNTTIFLRYIYIYIYVYMYFSKEYSWGRPSKFYKECYTKIRKKSKSPIQDKASLSILLQEL